MSTQQTTPQLQNVYATIQEHYGLEVRQHGSRMYVGGLTAANKSVAQQKVDDAGIDLSLNVSISKANVAKLYEAAGGSTLDDEVSSYLSAPTKVQSVTSHEHVDLLSETLHDVVAPDVHDALRDTGITYNGKNFYQKGRNGSLKQTEALDIIASTIAGYESGPIEEFIEVEPDYCLETAVDGPDAFPQEVQTVSRRGRTGAIAAMTAATLAITVGAAHYGSNIAQAAGYLFSSPQSNSLVYHSPGATGSKGKSGAKGSGILQPTAIPPSGSILTPTPPPSSSILQPTKTAKKRNPIYSPTKRKKHASILTPTQKPKVGGGIYSPNKGSSGFGNVGSGLVDKVKEAGRDANKYRINVIGESGVPEIDGDGVHRDHDDNTADYKGRKQASIDQLAQIVQNDAGNKGLKRVGAGVGHFVRAATNATAGTASDIVGGSINKVFNSTGNWESFKHGRTQRARDSMAEIKNQTTYNGSQKKWYHKAVDRVWQPAKAGYHHSIGRVVDLVSLPAEKLKIAKNKKAQEVIDYTLRLPLHLGKRTLGGGADGNNSASDILLPPDVLTGMDRDGNGKVSGSEVVRKIPWLHQLYTDQDRSFIQKMIAEPLALVGSILGFNKISDGKVRKSHGTNNNSTIGRTGGKAFFD